jgi:hypothetical protein
MLATALGVCACQQGRRVKFITLAALANELGEAASRDELSRVVARYARIDVLLLDLCRYRDYADIDPAIGVGCLISLGFSPVAPAGVSA